MKKEKFLMINRDLSWLSFNDRVLQEAEDENVPLLERLMFLGIHSSNRDEFFRVRVATIKRIKKIGGSKAKAMLGGFDPGDVLKEIQQHIIHQQERFEQIYETILKELALKGIFIINETQLSPEQGVIVRNYFQEQVLPNLVPIMLDNTPKFPYLKDRGIYFFVAMTQKNNPKKIRHAIIEIPTDILSRFFVLPKEKKYIILLDDIIRYCLDDIFFNFEYDSINAYTIKITRDAELDIEQDVTKSLVKKVSESIKRRKSGAPVRLTFDETMPKELLSFIMKRIKFSKEDHPIAGGRYHNFVDFIRFPSLDKPDLKYKIAKPLQHRDLLPKTSLLNFIKQKDVLLCFPYQSYHYIVDVLREASVDTKVRSISITLYRLGKNSHIVNTLLNAIKNGKSVTVIIELQARFDEEANIRWANKLNEEGARVIYGVPGLKAHSKLFLITRSEHGKDIHYAHIGTGNFNEDTAKLYCDYSLLTADKRITEEVMRVFHFYIDNYKPGNYKHLIVSPIYMRKRFLQLISKEMENVKNGHEAWLFLKLNSITDAEVIQKLYDAGNAGVKIRMIVRSICSLVPGIKQLSENIEVISIVDRYLEHSRVLAFCNNGETKIYLSSGDWMARNLDFRSEVATPVYNKEIKKQLLDILELQWADNVKARVVDLDQTNTYRHTSIKHKNRSQENIYTYLS